MSEFFRAFLLMLVLLNPFLVIVYLLDVVEKLDKIQFAQVLWRGCLIAWGVFAAFALLGEGIFANLMQARFASFQMFGGVVFLLIGVQFVFNGPKAIAVLRGESDNLAGAIAMPVLVGPGTISASVLVGERVPMWQGVLAIGLAVFLAYVVMVLLKMLHDYVRPRREPLVERYIEIAGRLTALFVGTISVEMLMQGLRSWTGAF
jgi:small neutral amino acid transporter SnatA (MarC family)